jgi:hypothetical protein
MVKAARYFLPDCCGKVIESEIQSMVAVLPYEHLKADVTNTSHRESDRKLRASGCKVAGARRRSGEERDI